jgi:transcriptional regulator with XRE-family HTH domain
MAKITDYQKWREQQMQDSEFVAELEKLEPGYQVARLRIKLGITQAQLAEIVGTKQPSIARLENGDSSPSLSFLEKVAEALGAEVKVNLVLKTNVHVIREGSGAIEYKSNRSEQ